MIERSASSFIVRWRAERSRRTTVPTVSCKSAMWSPPDHHHRPDDSRQSPLSMLSAYLIPVPMLRASLSPSILRQTGVPFKEDRTAGARSAPQAAPFRRYQHYEGDTTDDALSALSGP